MAAAHRGAPQYRTAVKRSVQARSVTAREVPAQVLRGKKQLGRAFVVLAVPVLLMMGSVYVHSIAARLEGEVARLEEQKNMAEGEGERLEVKLTELSEPERIRAQAKDNLGMQDPSKNLYKSNGEDVAVDGGEKDKAPGQ